MTAAVDMSTRLVELRALFWGLDSGQLHGQEASDAYNELVHIAIDAGRLSRDAGQDTWAKKAFDNIHDEATELNEKVLEAMRNGTRIA